MKKVSSHIALYPFLGIAISVDVVAAVTENRIYPGFYRA